MALNPFFLQGSQGEQSLVQDLINEQLRMYGVEVYYLPRQYVTKNKVIREVITSEFNQSYPIEAYVDNFDGYGENTVLLSKFGVQATSELKLIISQERFSSYITPLIKNLPNIELATRPKEGDLIYFPLGDRLFEIKFVEHEKPFYQLQKNYVYELTCELFRGEDEVLDTGIEEIDDTFDVEGNIRSLTLIGSGSTATAISGRIASGAVNQIIVTSRGEKYNYPPTVAISSAPTGGIRATGLSTLRDDIVNCDGTLIGSKVQGVFITNPGAGYTVNPGIVFVGLSTNPGVGAAATTRISDNTVGVVTISDGGGGYVSAPTVTFSSLESEQPHKVSPLCLLQEQSLQFTLRMLVLDTQWHLLSLYLLQILVEVETLFQQKPLLVPQVALLESSKLGIPSQTSSHILTSLAILLLVKQLLVLRAVPLM